MSWLDGLRHRIRVLTHRSEYAAERAEERRFHREMEAAAGRGGGGPDAEAYDAVREPGGSDGDGGPKPRRISTLGESLAQDLRYALRGLSRAPGFAAVAVLTLALGVGANAAVFSLLDRLFNQPPAGVRDPDSLRRLYVELANNPFEPGMLFPAFNYAAYSAVSDVADGAYDVVAWTPSSEATLREGEREIVVRTSHVTHDYFDVLGVGAARGRLFGLEEARVDAPAPVAVLGHGLWQRAFGRDPAVIGRTVELPAGEVTVIGVAAEGFAGLELSYADVFLPLSVFPVSPQQGRAWYQTPGNYLRTAARIRGPVDDVQISARATAAYLRRTLPPGGRQTIDSADVVLTGSIVELRGPGRRAGTQDHRNAVSISTRMSGVSAILLLIACANVAALLLVRADRRRREIAVRLALGISRARLGLQLLVEGLLLAVVASAAAVLVATLGGRALREMLLPEIRFAGPTVEPRTLAFAVATAALVGVLAGLAPALASRRMDVGASLKAGTRAGRARQHAGRTALIATQAALSLVLLVGAGLFVRSFGSASALRLGFDVEGVAFVRRLESALGAADHAGAVAEVTARLAEAPGVSGVALAFSPPMMGYGGSRTFLRGEGADGTVPASEPATYNIVSAEYFEVVGTRVLEGRTFGREEVDGVVVVDEAMARAYWPGRSAVGECVVSGRPDAECRTVIGVVEDQRESRVLEAEPTRQYFLPVGAVPSPQPQSVLLRIDPRRWEQIAQVAREVTSPRFERTVQIRRMSDALEAQFRPWRVGAQLFTAFALLALLVTAVGVYGVMAYTVSQRTHEVGVRMALGAELADVLRLVLGDGLRVVALGAVLGVAAALALGRLVESFLYGVTARDPASAAAAAAILLVAGAAASFLPAWRAGRVDPCEALRHD